MKIIVTTLLMLAATAAMADSTLEQALQATVSEDYVTALPLWEQLGGRGDRNAMIEAGLIYHQGLGTPVDHERALDWYLTSMNGDAANNIGVMFRDGTGLPLNRKVAYLLFLTIHMTGNGNESTIMRANRNLCREIADGATDREGRRGRGRTNQELPASGSCDLGLGGWRAARRASRFQRNFRRSDGPAYGRA